MDLFDSKYLYRTQKTIAIMAIVFCVVAIFLNLFSYAEKHLSIRNIITIVPILIIYIYTFYANNKIARIIQASMFFLTGLFTIFLDHKTRFAGDIFLTIAILIFYAFRIVKNYSLPVILSLCFGIFGIRFIALVLMNNGMDQSLFIINVVISFFATFILLFTTSILKNDLQWYLDEIKRYTFYSKAGQNYIGMIHALNLDKLLVVAERVKAKIEADKKEEALEFANDMISALNKKNHTVNIILDGAKKFHGHNRQDTNIHKLINDVVELEKVSYPKFAATKFNFNLYEDDIFLHISESDLFLIVQNIISNSLKAVNNQPGEGNITIKTELHNSKVIITIQDTGKGFDFSKTNINGSSKKENIKGYGLFYTVNTVKQNHGEIKFYNRKSGGAEVKIIFPVKGESNEELLIKFD